MDERGTGLNDRMLMGEEEAILRPGDVITVVERSFRYENPHCTADADCTMTEATSADVTAPSTPSKVKVALDSIAPESAQKTPRRIQQQQQAAAGFKSPAATGLANEVMSPKAKASSPMATPAGTMATPITTAKATPIQGTPITSKLAQSPINRTPSGSAMASSASRLSLSATPRTPRAAIPGSPTVVDAEIVASPKFGKGEVYEYPKEEEDSLELTAEPAPTVEAVVAEPAEPSLMDIDPVPVQPIKQCETPAVVEPNVCFPLPVETVEAASLIDVQDSADEDAVMAEPAESQTFEEPTAMTTETVEMEITESTAEVVVETPEVVQVPETTPTTAEQTIPNVEETSPIVEEVSTEMAVQSAVEEPVPVAVVIAIEPAAVVEVVAEVAEPIVEVTERVAEPASEATVTRTEVSFAVEVPADAEAISTETAAPTGSQAVDPTPEDLALIQAIQAEEMSTPRRSSRLSSPFSQQRTTAKKGSSGAGTPLRQSAEPTPSKAVDVVDGEVRYVLAVSPSAIPAASNLVSTAKKVGRPLKTPGSVSRSGSRRSSTRRTSMAMPAEAQSPSLRSSKNASKEDVSENLDNENTAPSENVAAEHAPSARKRGRPRKSDAAASVSTPAKTARTN